MERSVAPLAALLPLALLATATHAGTAAHEHGYPIAAVPFTRVRVTDSFWAPRVEANRAVTIPFGFKKSEEEGRIRDFERAAGTRPGGFEGKFPFNDSDVYN